MYFIIPLAHLVRFPSFMGIYKYPERLEAYTRDVQAHHVVVPTSNEEQRRRSWVFEENGSSRTPSNVKGGTVGHASTRLANCSLVNHPCRTRFIVHLFEQFWRGAFLVGESVLVAILQITISLLVGARLQFAGTATFRYFLFLPLKFSSFVSSQCLIETKRTGFISLQVLGFTLDRGR